MPQSLRIASFAAAATAFAISTNVAFFRAPLPPPNTPRPGLFGAAWWTRPIEFNSSSRLHRVEPGVDFNCISALVGGGDIWVGGSDGLLIHSADDGETWKKLPIIAASPVPSRPRAQTSPPPVKLSRLRGPVQQSEIIRIGMPESTPRPLYSPRPGLEMEQRPMNEAAPFTNPAQSIMPVNPTQAPPEISFPGESLPPLPQSLTSNTLVDLQFLTTSLGYAVADSGDILTTDDGGRSWRLLRPVESGEGPPTRVRFADERRGLVVGKFGIASTEDGGESWSAPAPDTSVVSDVVLMSGLNGLAVGLFPAVLEVVEGKNGVAIGQRFPVSGLKSSAARFVRIAKAGTQTVFAGSNEGVIARSANGGAWQGLDTGTTAFFTGLFFVSDREGWAVSEEGSILATQDRGESWTPQSSGTQAALRDVYFASATRGFVLGQNGTFLGTNDGGQSWSPLVTVAVGRPGRHVWLPAPWYWATLLLLLGLVRRIPEEAPPATSEGIGQILVSDKPLEADDPDYLGFREVAWGLSNYLRNKATKPPLTIAITGEWGMGKSSLMNLLQSDLEHYKFRPVWFNAWHHQTEEHLLAALLENIRTQAIPNVFTPVGMVFRAKLLWLRARTHLFATLLLIAAVTFVLGYYLNGQYGPLEALEHLTRALQKPSEIPEKFVKNSEAAKAVLAFVMAAFSLHAFVASFKAFGVNPASLLASKSNAAKASDLRAQTSFRHKFATEFREVTQSLNPLTMVVFIDDLDRCRPEQVYDMLESINFLISCGDCFVVMGLARRRVERCVGLVFEKIAAESSAASDGKSLDEGQKRQHFARQYLEKLINIEVPVPQGAPDQIKTLLTSTPPETAPPGKWEVMARKLDEMKPHLVPLAACVVVAVFAIWFSTRIIPPGEKTADETPVVATATPSPPPLTSPVPGFTPPPETVPQPSPARRLGSARFVLGHPGQAPIWAILIPAFVLLVPGIIRLSRRSGAVIEDSPDFIQALKAWFPVLANGPEMTPRGVKRFVNRVRYFAMMEGSFQPALRWWEQLAQFRHPRASVTPAVPRPGTKEDLLVALATLHERHPEWFAQDHAHFLESLEGVSDWRETEESMVEQVKQVDQTIFRHFQKLVAGVEVR